LHELSQLSAALQSMSVQGSNKIGIGFALLSQLFSRGGQIGAQLCILRLELVDSMLHDWTETAETEREKIKSTRLAFQEHKVTSTNPNKKALWE
jgi:hypothetical protein